MHQVITSGGAERSVGVHEKIEFTIIVSAHKVRKNMNILCILLQVWPA